MAHDQGIRVRRRLIAAVLGWAALVTSAPVAAADSGTIGGQSASPAMAPGLRAELVIDPSIRDALASLADADAGASPGAGGTTSPTNGTGTSAGIRAKPPVPAKADPRYTGTNHVWSAALGLDRRVVWFSCSRSRPPDMAVYRWGCAGANNVYLFAHAGGPFHRLHDLYVGGRLRRGMTVTFADAAGRIHRYAVAWWRVVLPTDGDFAFAAQSRPSLTLQTCVGPHDRYRLVVRLYETGRT
jgi:Sortase domain